MGRAGRSDLTYERSLGNPYLTELLLADAAADIGTIEDALLASWHRLEITARTVTQILGCPGGVPCRWTCWSTWPVVVACPAMRQSPASGRRRRPGSWSVTATPSGSATRCWPRSSRTPWRHRPLRVCTRTTCKHLRYPLTCRRTCGPLCWPCTTTRPATRRRRSPGPLRQQPMRRRWAPLRQERTPTAGLSALGRGRGRRAVRDR